MKNMAPLPHEYMLAGIFGFFVSIFLFESRTWSFALGLFFLLVIVASLISLSGDRMDEESLDLIAPPHYQKKKRKTLKR